MELGYTRGIPWVYPGTPRVHPGGQLVRDWRFGAHVVQQSMEFASGALRYGSRWAMAPVSEIPFGIGVYSRYTLGYPVYTLGGNL